MDSTTEGVTDMNEALHGIVAAGFAGVKLYEFGSGRWMGCLVRNDLDMTADTSTNLWNYAPSPSAAVAGLLKTAEKLAGGAQ